MPPLGYRHFDQVLDAARRKSIELDALQAYWLVSLLLSSDGQTGSNSQLVLSGPSHSSPERGALGCSWWMVGNPYLGLFQGCP